MASPPPSDGGGSSSIAAFASLDYRLGPHPEFPQDPAKTPPSEYRGARHPDHVRDIRAAVAYLQRQYGPFGSRYVLVGHSAGASLALQLVVGQGEKAEAEAEQAADPLVPLPLPRAIVGFEGVFDFRGLDARMGGGYAGFLAGAFGDDRAAWDAAAPMTLAGRYGERWQVGDGGRGDDGKVVAVLGWSPEDDLIDEPEIDGMAARLRRDGVEPLLFKDLRGRHDEIWEDGRDVARMTLSSQ